MTNPDPLTERELQAAAYFAVGVTSEGSIGGRDVAYRLSFAGNVGPGGRMEPVANSGYSFGTLQIDLGQHPAVARDLLDGYQAWAATQPDRARLALGEGAYDATLTSLQRTGREMRADGAVDIDRANLNRYLSSDAGRGFVHGLDTAHVHGVTATDDVAGNRDSALERLQRTDLYRNAAGDDQAELAGMFMKLQNQAGQGRWPGLLDRVEAGTLTSPAEVKTAIDGFLPNQRNGNPDYLESGADNTLRGIGVLNALRGAEADNPLSRAWTNVTADPLVGPVAAHRPTAANPDLGVQYDTIRSLYLTPEGSRRLIDALDRGGALAEGNPQPQANGSRQAGFYVSGNDFVHWNRNGQGQGYIDGQWRTVDPDTLARVRNADGTTELMIEADGRREPLLRVDPRSPALRADIAPLPADVRYAMIEDDRVADAPAEVALAHTRPFGNAQLNDMAAAVGAGDDTGARRAAEALAQSPAGLAFAQRGSEEAARLQREAAEQAISTRQQDAVMERG